MTCPVRAHAPHEVGMQYNMALPLKFDEEKDVSLKPLLSWRWFEKSAAHRKVSSFTSDVTAIQSTSERHGNKKNENGRGTLRPFHTLCRHNVKQNSV